MLRTLTLTHFKNFESATLSLGPLTLLVGANASGKSNLRDAFRFLHGISRGYTLAEILGEKWGEGGVLHWEGIRGGLKETAFHGRDSFQIEARVDLPGKGRSRSATYAMEVLLLDGRPPAIGAEWLLLDESKGYVFDTHPDGEPLGPSDPHHITVRVAQPARGPDPRRQFLSDRPVLTQLASDSRFPKKVTEPAQSVIQALAGMRFLDLEPDYLRRPSLPGQVWLGDKGQNLSSVLQRICEDDSKKQALLSWLKELTPMDATDFAFPSDLNGRILVQLVEASGNRVSANSASQGTLRFLAMLAAFLGPEPASLYFFEELENGIHPTRLALLLQLIEQQVRSQDIQFVATTHSPQLLGLVSAQTLPHASLVYRLTGQASARITPLLEIPDVRRVLEKQDFGRLMSSGFLEDAVYLTAPEDASTA